MLDQPRLLAPGAITACVLALSPACVLGTTLVWDNAGGGPAGVAANWNPSQTPTENDDLLFDLPGSYAVLFGGTVPRLGDVTVDDGSPAFDFISSLNTIEGDLRIGFVPNLAPIVSVRSGSPTLTGRTFIGYGVDRAGTLIIEDGATPRFEGFASDVFVGFGGGEALMEIRDGAVVSLERPMLVGASSEGLLQIDGAAPVAPFTRSTLTVDEGLYAASIGGQGGHGIVAVTGGALADVGTVVLLGSDPGGLGELVVEGTGGEPSELLLHRDLFIGAGFIVDSSPGGGGSVVVGDDGVVTVDGATWTYDPDGSDGGTIEVQPGGIFTTHDLHLETGDDLRFAGGQLVVSGGTLDFNDTNTGALEIDPSTPSTRGQARLGDVTARLTLEDGASGHVRSFGNAGPALRVGNLGEGKLVVRDAELTVHDFNAVAGDEPGSSGILDLTDGGVLTVNEHLILGREGYGAMNVLSGSEAWLARDLRCATRDGGTGGVIIEAGSAVHVGGALAMSGTPTTPAQATGAGLVWGDLWLDDATRSGDLWPGSELALFGGTLHLAGPLGIAGTLNVDDGATSGGTLEVGASGRVEASGTLDSRILAPSPSSEIVATGDLTIGRSDAASGIDLGGQLRVLAHAVTLVDGDSAKIGDVTLEGGTLTLAGNNPSVLESGHTLVGRGKVVGALQVRGAVYAGFSPFELRSMQEPELAFSGSVTGTGQGMYGTRYRLLAGTSFHASGTVEAAVSVDESALLYTTGPLSLGDPAGGGAIEVDGDFYVGGEHVQLVAAAPTRVGGTLALEGGRLDASQPVRIATDGRLIGTGLIGGVVLLEGTIAPGHSAGALGIAGLEMAPSARLAIELGDHASGEWDTLLVTDGATLRGALELTARPTFVDAPDDSFLVVAGHDVEGAFDEITFDGASAVGLVEVVYTPHGVYIVTTGSTTPVEETQEPGAPAPVPTATVLAQNAPNPFNPTTTIRYALANAGPVRLRVFDASGRMVRSLVDRVQSPSHHVVSWDGRDDNGRGVGSGVYLYRLDAPGFRETRRMILAK